MKVKVDSLGILVPKLTKLEIANIFVGPLRYLPVPGDDHDLNAGEIMVFLAAESMATRHGLWGQAERRLLILSTFVNYLRQAGLKLGIHVEEGLQRGSAMSVFHLGLIDWRWVCFSGINSRIDLETGLVDRGAAGWETDTVLINLTTVFITRVTELLKQQTTAPVS